MNLQEAFALTGVVFLLTVIATGMTNIGPVSRKTSRVTGVILAISVPGTIVSFLAAIWTGVVV